MENGLRKFSFNCDISDGLIFLLLELSGLLLELSGSDHSSAFDYDMKFNKIIKVEEPIKCQQYIIITFTLQRILHAQSIIAT